MCKVMVLVLCARMEEKPVVTLPASTIIDMHSRILCEWHTLVSKQDAQSLAFLCVIIFGILFQVLNTEITLKNILRCMCPLEMKVDNLLRISP